MSRIRRLSPFGPLFDKELRVASRRKRNYVLRVFYLGVLLLILLLAHAATGDSSGGITRRVQRQAELGLIFFGCFTIFSIVAMGIIGPVLTCTAIGSERLAKTLHVLLMTPLNAWQIVGGKLFSRLLLALMLIGLSLPVLAVVRLLGGVELWQMIAAIVLAASVALFSASIGLWLSTIINRAYAVILLAYAVMAVIYLFIPFVIGMLLRFGAGPGNPSAFLNLMGAMNPVFAGGAGIIAHSNLPVKVHWWLCAATHLTGAGLLTALSAWSLRRQQQREGLDSIGYPAEVAPPLAGAGPDANGSPTDDSAERQPAGVVPASLNAAPAERSVADNPIRWRELRQPILAQTWQRVLAWVFAAGVIGVVYLLFAIEGDFNDAETHVFFAGMYHFVLWLLSAVLSASLIATEKESDTWTLLLATPLLPNRIVWGKLAGLLWRLRWLAALILAHFVFFCFAGALSWQTSLLVILVTFTFNAVWMATGLYLSLRLASVTFAVVINLLLGVAIYAIVPLAEAAFQEFILGRLLEGPYTGMLWPYYYLVAAVDGLRPSGGTRSIDLLGSGTSVSSDAFVLLTLTMCAIHLFAAWGIVAWIIRRFDRIVGRAPQVEPLAPAAANAQFVAG